VLANVKEKDDAKKRVKLDCLVTNQKGEVVLKGESRLMPPTHKVRVPKIDAPRIQLFAPEAGHQELLARAEGLEAEALRRPGLVQALQTEHRVSLAGPTTLLALLNSLQMGFRTLALEKRSTEVWEVLGAVKTEFAKFGATLARVRGQTQTVLNTLGDAETRTRQMTRALKTVEALPEARAQSLLPGSAATGDDGDADA
jgi:hypothetical protein